MACGSKRKGVAAISTTSLCSQNENDGLTMDWHRSVTRSGSIRKLDGFVLSMLQFVRPIWDCFRIVSCLRKARLLEQLMRYRDQSEHVICLLELSCHCPSGHKVRVSWNFRVVHKLEYAM
jgi:hypothetical protein